MRLYTDFEVTSKINELYTKYKCLKISLNWIGDPIKSAILGSNNPSDTNVFVTEDVLQAAINSVGIGTNIFIVDTYSNLPIAAPINAGEFYWVENDQGVKWTPDWDWLPGGLGAPFHPLGLYYSTGTTWETAPVPYQATQIEVDAGTDQYKFVTPATLENSNKWGDYVLVSNHGNIVGNLTVSGNTGINLTGAGGTGIKFYSVGINFLSPGQITLNTTNNVIIGGNTASATFPSLKRDGTNLQARLADDSNFTFIEDLYRRSGAGSPEGIVTAPIGSIYHRNEGSIGTTIYLKESGTGNTGWKQISPKYSETLPSTLTHTVLQTTHGLSKVSGVNLFTSTGDNVSIQYNITSNNVTIDSNINLLDHKIEIY